MSPRWWPPSASHPSCCEQAGTGGLLVVPESQASRWPAPFRLPRRLVEPPRVWDAVPRPAARTCGAAERAPRPHPGRQGQPPRAGTADRQPGADEAHRVRGLLRAALSRDGTPRQATVEELSLRPQPPRRCQTSRRSSYTVIGSPERPRPWPRTTNPSLAASWRDAALSSSSM